MQSVLITTQRGNVGLILASAILKGDGSKGYYYKCCTINYKGILAGYCSIKKMMRMKLLVKLQALRL